MKCHTIIITATDCRMYVDFTVFIDLAGVACLTLAQLTMRCRDRLRSFQHEQRGQCSTRGHLVTVTLVMSPSCHGSVPQSEMDIHKSEQKSYNKRFTTLDIKL